MKWYCQQLTLISLKAKIHTTVVISPGISSNSKSTLNKDGLIEHYRNITNHSCGKNHIVVIKSFL